MANKQFDSILTEGKVVSNMNKSNSACSRPYPWPVMTQGATLRAASPIPTAAPEPKLSSPFDFEILDKSDYSHFKGTSPQYGSRSASTSPSSPTTNARSRCASSVSIPQEMLKGQILPPRESEHGFCWGDSEEDFSCERGVEDEYMGCDSFVLVTGKKDVKSRKGGKDIEKQLEDSSSSSTSADDDDQDEDQFVMPSNLNTKTQGPVSDIVGSQRYNAHPVSDNTTTFSTEPQVCTEETPLQDLLLLLWKIDIESLVPLDTPPQLSLYLFPTVRAWEISFAISTHQPTTRKPTQKSMNSSTSRSGSDSTSTTENDIGEDGGVNLVYQLPGLEGMCECGDGDGDEKGKKSAAEEGAGKKAEEGKEAFPAYDENLAMELLMMGY